jgi:signal transduction histidine kinase
MEAMAETGADPRRLIIKSSHTQKPDICVSVFDTGPGVSPHIMARLFDPFFTTKTNGIGMGLAICRSIIEAHGGRLWATANEPHGAVFHFVLPATAASC